MNPKSFQCLPAVLLFCLALANASASAQAPPLPAITLDEFLNTTEIAGARISPDGTAAVIGTESPDWKADTYRHTLWLWTANDGLRTLTQSGSDEDAEFSPDGKWIAFLSDRPIVGAADDDEKPAEPAASAAGDAKQRALDGHRSSEDSGEDKTTRLWLISLAGGEAQPLFREKLDVHAFAWSADGKSIFFSAAAPLPHDQEATQKEQWKDVIRWREQERGDLLLALPVAAALTHTAAVPMAHPASLDKSQTKSANAESKSDDPALPLPSGATTLAKISLEIAEIAPSPDGKSLAWLTNSISHRMENPADTEVFLLPAAGGNPRQLTHNSALEAGLRWSPDSKFLHFAVKAAGGSLEGKYQDVQGRLYRLNPASSSENIPVERLGANFVGSFDDFAFLPSGQLVALGLKGTAQQLYTIDGPKATPLPALPGTYASISVPTTGSSLLVRYSAINQPAQVYLAPDASHPDKLTALTQLNPIFAERQKPAWIPYTWKAPDGVSVEGVLIFPIGISPGSPAARHLRMLTFIHGGPADADGNRFGADWYDWATMAATQGWLVFRPNYRGSTGYGDEFMLQIAPRLVSKPGEDILAGVDALVKDGYADPEKLAIGGYSYGGYMTNWLITETTRFKVAVTGAGAVEHAANWGNDDVTFDDAWYLNGMPWQTPANYQSEAALFRMNRVKTPTHIVQGSSDVRVSYLEGVTLERALQQLGIPHHFLVFPGEGHSLGNNPWHGYIKLREELLWLDNYIGK